MNPRQTTSQAQAGRRSRDDASSATASASSSSAARETGPTESASDWSAEREYVRAVLDYYLWLPSTACVTSRHDRSCARALFRQGVPLSLVKAAMALAVARRLFRVGDPLPRIRALHFFRPVIEELVEEPCDPDYVGYLEHKLRPLADQKVRTGVEPGTDPQRGADDG